MPMQPQQQQQQQQPVTRHRRDRRSSVVVSDSASVVAQLTHGLTLTYAQSKPPPPPLLPPSLIQPRSASATMDSVRPSKTKSRGAHQHHKSHRISYRKANGLVGTPSDSSSPHQHHHRRLLTKKTKPSGNDGLDNEEQNLIVRVRDVFGGRDALPVQPEFIVLHLLGQGTFGQVFRCQNVETKEHVAIKVIRNHPSYYKQAIVEVQITRLLNASYTADEAPHFVRMKDTFEFRNHLCIVFELLSINVYELIAENNFNGFPLDIARGFQQQLLHALVRMDEIGVIHCDLKPENILLVGQDQFLSDVAYHNDPQMARLLAIRDAHGFDMGGGISTTAGSGRLATGHTPFIKVVDFGSACMENETVYSYIQSRFYRSPEVLLGIPYTGAIDLWSLGCIAVEMFLGLPLFPGVSEHDQLRLIEATLGKLPQALLRQGRNVLKYYNVSSTTSNHFVLKTPAEFARDTNAEVQMSKKYFKFTKLDDMIDAYPYAKHATAAQQRLERTRREAFLHFVKGLLRVDPHERWSARVAMRHPFMTGEPFVRDHVDELMQQPPAPVPVPVPVPVPTLTASLLCGNSWSSPAPVVSSEYGGSTTYSDSETGSIWGPSGMPPYAPGQPHYLQHQEEPLSPATGYQRSHDPYPPQSQHHQHQHLPCQRQYQLLPGEKVGKVAPSTYIDASSSRVYPYDPYHNQKGYDDALAYSPLSAYPPVHWKVTPTPTHSMTSSSDGFPVVPVSPYDTVHQEYDSPYYAPPPPHASHHHSSSSQAGIAQWPWGDSVRYDAPPPPIASAEYGGGSGHREPEMWRHESVVPRHHQYSSGPPEPSPSQPSQPLRRGKRQHTNSWDSGDKRELRRHEAAHPQSNGHAPRSGYAPPPSAYATPSHRPSHGGSSGSGNGSAAGRGHSTPRRTESKGRSGGTTRHHRKSPKSSSAVKSHPPPQPHHPHHQYPHAQPQYPHHRPGLETQRSPPLYQQYSQPPQSSQPPRHLPYHASVARRDESTGVCSVEEKFSSVMSLDLPNAAVPLPT